MLPPPAGSKPRRYLTKLPLSSSFAQLVHVVQRASTARHGRPSFSGKARIARTATDVPYKQVRNALRDLRHEVNAAEAADEPRLVQQAGEAVPVVQRLEGARH
jgi:hypothetical protein